MRSRFTSANPAARAAVYARRADAGPCTRSSAASTSGSNDCTPIESRVNPAASSRSSRGPSTVSGLASVVISASGATSNPSRRWPSSPARTSPPRVVGVRSEEHTSELQSRFDLVCRLLLEKKQQILERKSGNDIKNNDNDTQREIIRR